METEKHDQHNTDTHSTKQTSRIVTFMVNLAELLTSPTDFFEKQRTVKKIRDSWFFALMVDGFTALLLTSLQVRVMKSELFHPLELVLAPIFFTLCMGTLLGGLFVGSAVYYAILWVVGKTEHLTYIRMFSILSYSHIFVVALPFILVMQDARQMLLYPIVLILMMAFRYVGFRFTLNVSIRRLVILFVVEAAILVTLIVLLIQSLP